MARIEKEIDVNVPVSVAYNQWTQFEEFPTFMEGVKAVRQLDDRHLLWHAEILGKDETWEAEITEQIPDRRIAWRSTTGARNAGIVTFQPMGEGATKILLTIEYEPEGATERVGDWLGIVSQRVEGDLRRFKEAIERSGRESGAWRGTITGGGVTESARPERR